MLNLPSYESISSTATSSTSMLWRPERRAFKCCSATYCQSRWSVSPLISYYKWPVFTFNIYSFISTGCDYTNSQLGFSAFQIYGILCDGKSFEFYRFDPLTFSRCRYGSAPPACYTLSVANLSGHRTMYRANSAWIWFFIFFRLTTRQRAIFIFIFYWCVIWAFFSPVIRRSFRSPCALFRSTTTQIPKDTLRVRLPGILN